MYQNWVLLAMVILVVIIFGPKDLVSESLSQLES